MSGVTLCIFRTPGLGIRLEESTWNVTSPLFLSDQQYAVLEGSLTPFTNGRLDALKVNIVVYDSLP